MPADGTGQGAAVEWWAASDLRRRGWTGSLVRRFAPTPSAAAPNPHCSYGAPMRLYQAAEIQAIEQSPAFQNELMALHQTRAASRARVRALEEQLLDIAHSIPIALPDWDLATLRQHADAHLRAMSVDLMPAHLRTPRSAGDAACVHYLIGWASIAEESMQPLWSRPGWTTALLALRTRMLLEIAIRYPVLREECVAQMRRLATSPDVEL